MYEDKLSEPVRETEINRAFGKLFSVIEMCQKEAETLIERLSPVLSGGGVSQGSDKAKTPEFSSGLAQEINKAIVRIDDLASRIRETRNRVEL